MAANRKYADLPDVDLAPDVYETPELTDDASTLPTSATVRSESPIEDGNDDIDRHRIDPDEARTHFLSSSERDPTNVTRITNKRRSYRSSSRRRRKDGRIVNGAGNLSDEEEGDDTDRESLDRKLARLRREVAEVKGEIALKQAAENADSAKKDKEEQDEGAQEVEALSKILESAGPAGQLGQHGQGEKGAASRLTARLLAPTIPSSLQQQEAPHHTPPPPTQAHTSQADPSSAPPSTSTTYTLTYAPTYNPTHTLAKISSFDKRLALLESALGIDTLPLLPSSSTTTSENPISKPLLPTLNKLDTQLSILTNTSASSLETLGRQIRHLTTEAKNLDAARKSAASASSSDPSSTTTTTATNTSNDPPPAAAATATGTKPEIIQALHGTLPTIHALSPLLPPTLDRLRSLRALHADAASAAQRLDAVEAAQAAVRSETRAWAEALAAVERKVAETERRGSGNLEVVEGWVRDVEGRVGRLGVRE